MASKTTNESEFNKYSKEVALAAVKKTFEFTKLSTGEKALMEIGFNFGAEFMHDKLTKIGLNS